MAPQKYAVFKCLSFVLLFVFLSVACGRRCHMNIENESKASKNRLISIQTQESTMNRGTPSDAKCDDISLIIHRDSDRILVILFNKKRYHEEAAEVVNARLLAGGNFVYTDIVFEIVDENGLEYPFKWKVNADMPSKADLVSLSPTRLIGASYSLDYLKDTYKLPPGVRYRIRARYQNNRAKIDGEDVCVANLTSNWVEFDLPIEP
jgi:hypothetical protein